MNYELGTIRVEAQFREEPDNKIETFRDITAKYDELGEKPKEHIYAVFLTNGNQEIGDKLLGLGSVDHVQFDTRDLARTAALVNAAATILVHNHPSGNPEPTQQDIQVTHEIHEALQHLGIELLDHVIISRNQNHSMKKHRQGPF